MTDDQKARTAKLHDLMRAMPGKKPDHVKLVAELLRVKETTVRKWASRVPPRVPTAMTLELLEAKWKAWVKRQEKAAG